MLSENRFNLFIRRKASLACGLQTAIDSHKFVSRRAIFSAFEPCVDFSGKLSKLLLGVLRPGFRALHRFFENFHRHINSISRPPLGATDKNGLPPPSVRIRLPYVS